MARERVRGTEGDQQGERRRREGDRGSDAPHPPPPRRFDDSQTARVGRSCSRVAPCGYSSDVEVENRRPTCAEPRAHGRRPSTMKTGAEQEERKRWRTMSTRSKTSEYICTGWRRRLRVFVLDVHPVPLHRRQEWAMSCSALVLMWMQDPRLDGRRAEAGKGGACAVLVALHLRVGDMAVRGASAAVLRNAGTAAESQDDDGRVGSCALSCKGGELHPRGNVDLRNESAWNAARRQGKRERLELDDGRGYICLGGTPAPLAPDWTKSKWIDSAGEMAVGSEGGIGQGAHLVAEGTVQAQSTASSRLPEVWRVGEVEDVVVHSRKRRGRDPFLHSKLLILEPPVKGL
ncbi:hypothetical protein B0H13DRAFT_1905148 [Mycena leptocephala]|nr:hypothetical protein B0H13DRAFT_1905148 [Mycena leptocephala]